eukprot:Clim_evm12s244 gene=Clim_evmTU12s244
MGNCLSSKAKEGKRDEDLAGSDPPAAPAAVKGETSGEHQEDKQEVPPVTDKPTETPAQDSVPKPTADTDKEEKAKGAELPDVATPPPPALPDLSTHPILRQTDTDKVKAAEKAEEEAHTAMVDAETKLKDAQARAKDLKSEAAVQEKEAAQSNYDEKVKQASGAKDALDTAKKEAEEHAKADEEKIHSGKLIDPEISAEAEAAIAAVPVSKHSPDTVGGEPLRQSIEEVRNAAQGKKPTADDPAVNDSNTSLPTDTENSEAKGLGNNKVPDQAKGAAIAGAAAVAGAATAAAVKTGTSEDQAKDVESKVAKAAKNGSDAGLANGATVTSEEDDDDDVSDDGTDQLVLKQSKKKAGTDSVTALKGMLQDAATDGDQDSQKHAKVLVAEDSKDGAKEVTRMSAEKRARARSHWLKSKAAAKMFVVNNKNWTQIAGHDGAFVKGSDKTIFKESTAIERNCFDSLLKVKDDPIWKFLPEFHGEVHKGEVAYLELEDLVSPLKEPCVLDVKMGTRTFLEKEVQNTKLRMDLLQKMLDVNPDYPTEEEKKTGVTKMRYMQFREEMSSSASEGFRMEGFRVHGEEGHAKAKRMRERPEIQGQLWEFCVKNKDIVSSYLKQLEEIHTTLQASQWFKEHSVVGSSLLFVHEKDGSAARVSFIDLGKTLPADHEINHRKAWEPGNAEDGYFTGLDNLIENFEEVLKHHD